MDAQHISSDSFNEKTLHALDPSTAAALHADVLVSQKKLVEVGSSAVLGQSAKQPPAGTENQATNAAAAPTPLKSSTRNLSPMNTKAQGPSLTRNDSKKSHDSPSPKSPAKIHHQSTARMQNVIDEHEKRQASLEKEAKATMKAQKKSGGYPKAIIEPQNLPNAMKPGLKKGSAAMRSISEVPITCKQEQLLGKVGPGSYQLPEALGQTRVKMRHHQFFGSSTSRFFGSLFDKGVGNGKPDVAPGAYEEHAELKKVEGLKKKDFKET